MEDPQLVMQCPHSALHVAGHFPVFLTSGVSPSHSLTQTPWNIPSASTNVSSSQPEQALPRAEEHGGSVWGLWGQMICSHNRFTQR